MANAILLSVLFSLSLKVILLFINFNSISIDNITYNVSYFGIYFAQYLLFLTVNLPLSEEVILSLFSYKDSFSENKDLHVGQK